MPNHGSESTNRRNFIKAVGVASIASVSGCTGVLDDDDVVRWASIDPVSGPFADMGEEQRLGIELGVEFVNESDDFDFDIELESYDSEAEPATARREASRATDEFGAEFITGGISSGVSLAMNDFAVDNEVLFTPTAADVRITGEDCTPWTFRVETHTAMMAQAIAEYAVDNLGDQIYYVGADYAFGHSVLQEVEARMQEMSPTYERLGDDFPALGSTDFEAFITNVASADPDFLLLGMVGADYVIFVQQAFRQGLLDDVDVMTVGGTFMVHRAPLEQASYGIYSSTMYVPEVPTQENDAFIDLYMDAYGEPPDSWAATGFDSIRMVSHGIEEADSTDPDDVREVLPGLEVTSIFGPNEFRECDHQATNPVWVAQMLEPDDGAIADVELLHEVPGDEALPPCEDVGCEM